MKLVAAIAVLVTLASAAGATGKSAPVLGFAWDNKQLAWFDPASLKQVSHRSAPIAYHTCAWELSADGARLASSLCGGRDSLGLRIVDVRAMRSLGDVPLKTSGWVDGMTWLRPDRLVVVANQDDGGALLFVVDPAARRVVRRVELGAQAGWVARVGDGVAFLLWPNGRFGPAQVAVADADGDVRRATIDAISVGTILDESGDEPSMKQRGAGFAVDPVSRTGFVVGPDLLVAEVKLDSLAVTYHRVVTRAVQKSIDGPQRSATWLGDGLLAVSGADYAAGKDANGRPTVASVPFGLRIVDTHDWSSRSIDGGSTWLQFAGGVLIAQREGRERIAFGVDGRERWRTTIPQYGWLDARGTYGYICDNGYLWRVLELATGRIVATLPKASNRRCAALLLR